MLRKMLAVAGVSLIALGATACVPEKAAVTTKVNQTLANHWDGDKISCDPAQPAAYGEWGNGYLWHSSDCLDKRGWPWSVRCDSTAAAMAWECTATEAKAPGVTQRTIGFNFTM